MDLQLECHSMPNLLERRRHSRKMGLVMEDGAVKDSEKELRAVKRREMRKDLHKLNRCMARAGVAAMVTSASMFSQSDAISTLDNSSRLRKQPRDSRMMRELAGDFADFAPIEGLDIPEPLSSTTSFSMFNEVPPYCKVLGEGAELRSILGDPSNKEPFEDFIAKDEDTSESGCLPEDGMVPTANRPTELGGSEHFTTVKHTLASSVAVRCRDAWHVLADSLGEPPRQYTGHFLCPRDAWRAARCYIFGDEEERVNAQVFLVCTQCLLASFLLCCACFALMVWAFTSGPGDASDEDGRGEGTVLLNAIGRPKSAARVFSVVLMSLFAGGGLAFCHPIRDALLCAM